MEKYNINAQAIFDVYFTVEANSEEEAMEKFHNGQAVMADWSEYVRMNTSYEAFAEIDDE